jgi:UPF0271 protein
VGSSFLHSRVHVTEPSLDSINRVKTTATKTGDLGALSLTDVSLLALALDLLQTEGGVSLVSDDFAVRNVANMLSVPLAQTSIKGGAWKNIAWKIYCRGCGKEYTNPKLTVCPVCGTQLARKASNG